MAAPVVKTLFGILPQHSPPELFATPTHSYYKALWNTATAHHYVESEAAKHCTNMIKADGRDATVANGCVINSYLQAYLQFIKDERMMCLV